MAILNIYFKVFQNVIWRKFSVQLLKIFLFDFLSSLITVLCSFIFGPVPGSSDGLVFFFFFFFFF